ncbi:MAG: hypothetical protein AB4368_05800 [Xenococcaceae cyanobacterium]
MLKPIFKLKSSSWLDRINSLNFSLRSLVAREPSLWILYQPYIWWRKNKRATLGKVTTVSETFVHNHTELVIDGFQGSANGFAVAGFKQHQSKYVQLAHHMHSPAEIIKAIDQKTPVILLIREPVGAVISLTSRWSYISVRQGLESYIKFYTKLSAYPDGYVVSTFEQTTQHLDRIVDRVNQKFDTDFDPIDISQAKSTHTPKDLAKNTRSQIKQQKKQELNLPENIKLLDRANQIYARYKAIANNQ